MGNPRLAMVLFGYFLDSSQEGEKYTTVEAPNQETVYSQIRKFQVCFNSYKYVVWKVTVQGQNLNFAGK